MINHKLEKVIVPVISMFFLFAPLAGAQTMMSADANLTVGSRGDSVVALQTFLETNGYLNLNGATKGYFGGLTKSALAKYQSGNGLPSTGFYGAMTRAKMMGGMLGSSMNMGNSAPNTMTKSADLRVLLHALEHEHVDLASAAVRAGFDGAGSFAAVGAQLDKNSVELSQAVGSIYGPAAEARFLEIWRSHIGFFVDYTVAAKKGDKAGMDKAVANLGGYVDAISDFFSGANPNLPREAVHQLVSTHVTLLKGAVDNYGAADFAGSYKSQHEAYVQIGSIADALSGAIVKQYPEKF